MCTISARASSRSLSRRNAGPAGVLNKERLTGIIVSGTQTFDNFVHKLLLVTPRASYLQFASHNKIISVEHGGLGNATRAPDTEKSDAVAARGHM